MLWLWCLDVGAEAGVCGLRNLGNTCFMSTGVQCLMATPALVHCLLHQPAPMPAKNSLTSHLSQLTHKIWSGQYSAVQPSDFKETLGTHYPQFKDFRQVMYCDQLLCVLKYLWTISLNEEKKLLNVWLDLTVFLSTIIWKEMFWHFMRCVVLI